MLSNSSINLTISAAKVRLIFDMTKHFAEKIFKGNPCTLIQRIVEGLPNAKSKPLHTLRSIVENNSYEYQGTN